MNLATASYATHKREHGVAVAISIGQPQWPLPYPLDHEIRDLMPIGLFGRGLPPEAFAAGYRARLDSIGIDRIREQIAEIAAVHAGRTLVLLCWERPGERCHRRTFADWWQAQTGEHVPETAPPPDPQTTLDFGGAA